MNFNFKNRRLIKIIPSIVFLIGGGGMILNFQAFIATAVNSLYIGFTQGDYSNPSWITFVLTVSFPIIFNFIASDILLLSSIPLFGYKYSGWKMAYYSFWTKVVINVLFFHIDLIVFYLFMVYLFHKIKAEYISS